MNALLTWVGLVLNVKSMSQMLGSTGLILTQFTEQFFLTLKNIMYPHKKKSLGVKNMLELDNHLSYHKYPRQAGLTEFNLV